MQNDLIDGRKDDCMSTNLNGQVNPQGQNHVRVINSLLGKQEKRLLIWLAARMPAWVVPDTLTALGIVAAVLIFLGYALTFYNKYFLWLASFGFFLHWFGDSLDGTLARYRKIERPRYGFFVDHILDTVSEAFIFIGIGLSPYVRFDLALLTLVIYLMVSIFVYLGTYVNGVFRISYAGLGPTETRLIAILANTYVFFANNPIIHLGTYSITFYDVVAILMCVVGILIFAVSSIQMASSLSKEDRTARREKALRERAARKQERAARRQAQREEYIRRKLIEREKRSQPGLPNADANQKTL